ncbi:hypothetical protein [Alkalibacillus aidingensis]|uniref:hypothetical protein n=1 Tax=Alkalibacillus aidingensis TaxID=2747607 RepID=UPI001660AF2B|nr:hypothetical protein [Alkalibacillus aidingensis]
MDWLNWYDWITPTNVNAAIVIGLIVVALILVFVWFQIKKIKVIFSLLITGTVTVVALALLLNWIGFYE